jgi:hypothetical protein
MNLKPENSRRYLETCLQKSTHQPKLALTAILDFRWHQKLVSSVKIHCINFRKTLKKNSKISVIERGHQFLAT